MRTAVAIAAAVLFYAPASASTTAEALSEALLGHDVVILGEVHDNPHHHEAQARLIDALEPAAVVFEMLTPDQAATANGEEARNEALARQLDWADSGWPDWALYEPVFQAVGQTPVHGMALPRDEVRRAVSEGAAAVLGQDAELFGLTRDLPEQVLEKRLELQFAAHCDALPKEMLGGMVEAQRLRDAAFARTVLAALRSDGAPVVVIAGTGHARTDWGIPAAISIAAPDVSVVSVGQFEADPDPDAPFDHWLVAPPAERPDPCEAFR